MQRGHRVPFPAHGTGGVCTGYHQRSPGRGCSTNPSFQPRSPLQQTIPSTQEKSTKLFKTEPKPSSQPMAALTATVQCPSRFYGPVLTAGSEERGESPASAMSLPLLTGPGMPHIPPCPLLPSQPARAQGSFPIPHPSGSSISGSL